MSHFQLTLTHTGPTSHSWRWICGAQGLASTRSLLVSLKSHLAPSYTYRPNKSLLALDLYGTGFGIRGIIRVCSALGAEGMEGDVNTSLLSLDLGNPSINSGPQVGVCVQADESVVGCSGGEGVSAQQHHSLLPSVDCSINSGLLVDECSLMHAMNAMQAMNK